MLPGGLPVDPRFSVDAAGSGVRFRLSGSVGLDEAFALRDLLARLDPRSVVLDFSGVEQVRDVILGVLGLWLADQGHAQVHMEGLGHHGLFVLRCCGYRTAKE